MTDFFISYTRVDKDWADWVAWVLEEAGHSVVLDTWDFRPGSNFMLAMDDALAKAERTLVILTPAYAESNYGRAEWTASMSLDPSGMQRKVVPVRVAPCEPPTLLRAITYIDLVGIGDEEMARKRLVESLNDRRAKPQKAPSYPGATQHRAAPKHPMFPAARAPSRGRGERAVGPGSGSTKATSLVRWRTYSREQIPPLLGQTFSEAIWNTGFVSIPGHMVLLVTLEKRSMAESFQYADHFLSPSLFQWQSQNRTTQGGKHGQLLSNHVAEGVEVHLFVRAEKKLRSGNAAPFTYCGPVRFDSWEGERPITVTWRLSEPVPMHLREELKVPSGQ
jgi:hypothetical protein